MRRLFVGPHSSASYGQWAAARPRVFILGSAPPNREASSPGLRRADGGLGLSGVYQNLVPSDHVRVGSADPDGPTAQGDADGGLTEMLGVGGLYARCRLPSRSPAVSVIERTSSWTRAAYSGSDIATGASSISSSFPNARSIPSNATIWSTCCSRTRIIGRKPYWYSHESTNGPARDVHRTLDMHW